MIFLFQMDSARWSGTRRVKHEQQKWDSSCEANWWPYKNKMRLHIQNFQRRPVLELQSAFPSVPAVIWS